MYLYVVSDDILNSKRRNNTIIIYCAPDNFFSGLELSVTYIQIVRNLRNHGKIGVGSRDMYVRYSDQVSQLGEAFV